MQGFLEHEFGFMNLSVLCLSVQVHKQTDDAASAHTKHQPSHVNVQHVIARFQQSRNDSSLIQSQPGCITATTPGGGSSENNNLPSVLSLLQRGQSVSVERDLPHATLEDFVQDSISLQSTDCSDYDRQVCLLLLQVLTGSLHLYNISASAPELRPLEIFLVWPNREKEEAGNKQRQDASLQEAMGWERMERKEKTLTLWRTLGSPRVVLTPLSPALPVPHPFIHIKSQIGALIQYCLHSQESLDSTQSKSPYRIGLLHLASLLQSESSGPQMADMVAMLQVLLWGPRVQLFDRRRPMTTAVHNWLAVKRALLVMKLAERGLVQDQSAVDWEDCMCLKFLSFADPETVVSATSQLWLTLNVD